MRYTVAPDVTVDAPGEVGTQLASFGMDDGTFVAYMLRDNLYSWSASSSEIISPTIRYGWRAPGGEDVALDLVSSSIQAALPVDLSGSSLNASLEDIQSRYGKLCQVWDDSSLSWTALAVSVPSAASVSLCASTHGLPAVLTVRVQLLNLPPGTRPLSHRMRVRAHAIPCSARTFATHITRTPG